MTVTLDQEQLANLAGVCAVALLVIGVLIGLVAHNIVDKIAPPLKDESSDSDETLGAMFRDYLNTRRLIEDDSRDDQDRL